MPQNLSIGDYVGLEVETENITSNQASSIIGSRTWKLDHDASCESDAKNIGKLLVTSLPKKPIFQTSNVTLGTEIVLYPPICLENDSSKLLLELEKLTEGLSALGEPGTSQEPPRRGG